MSDLVGNPEDRFSRVEAHFTAASMSAIIFSFFFNSVLRPFQDYFSSYEMGQSVYVGGAKTGEP